MIILQAGCILLATTLEILLQDKLPTEILRYVARTEEAPMSVSQQVGYGIGLLLLLGLIGSWVALWKLRPAARSFYAVCFLGSILLCLVLEPAYYYTPPGMMFNECSTLIGGFILGLLYFSDLSARFKKVKAESGAEQSCIE